MNFFVAHWKCWSIIKRRNSSWNMNVGRWEVTFSVMIVLIENLLFTGLWQPGLWVKVITKGSTQTQVGCRHIEISFYLVWRLLWRVEIELGSILQTVGREVSLRYDAPEHYPLFISNGFSRKLHCKFIALLYNLIWESVVWI